LNPAFLLLAFLPIFFQSRPKNPHRQSPAFFLPNCFKAKKYNSMAKSHFSSSVFMSHVMTVDNYRGPPRPPR
ncbi:hypothetical protein SLEP1_g60514, partial [Rubroshorea leprosula]